jgi:CRP/FNR family transcriptional regulator
LQDQKIASYKAGSYIYIEGDEDVESVYIVQSGHVKLMSYKHQVLMIDDDSGPGEMFGVISSLSGRPRMESAVAATDANVVIFKKSRFLLLLQQNSSIAIKLLSTYANQLRIYDTLIFPLEGRKDPLFPAEQGLFNLGRFYYQQRNYAIAAYVFERYMQIHPQGYAIKQARNFLNEMVKKNPSVIISPISDRVYRLYSDRQVVFCENEPGDELFIIKKGRVKIIKNHNDSEIVLSVLQEGDIFGELAIVSDKPRNATAVSFGPATLLPINKESLLVLMKKSPDILKRIFTAISHRVWFTIVRMEARIYKKPLTRVYAFLENKLLEDKISLKSREPHVLLFGIDELLKMTNLSSESNEHTMKEILADSNLNFNIGQIHIENPSLVSSKARYLKSRDHLYEVDETEQRPIEEFQDQQEIQDESGDLYNGFHEEAEPVEGVAKSDLFNELYREIRPDRS